MSETNSARTGAGETSGYRAYVLFILVVVYTFNFLDRQIIGILAVPIKEDLLLSDTELSLMGGLAFALFYTFLGIPVAWLADRYNRVWIMTIALTLWSAMTAVCGLAQNFWHLFLARLGVGVGEAGGVAPAYSLLADYFPQEKRARAMAIYSFGIPIGSALGILLGGIIASLIDWRAAFIIVGFAGILVAPFFRATMREPERGRYDAGGKVAPAPIGDVFRVLAGKPSFWILSFGAGFSSMMGYGLYFWLPSFFVRSYEAELPQLLSWLPPFMIPEGAGIVLYASYFFGAIVLIGGVAGIWLGGVLADFYGKARKSAYALFPAAAFTITLPFYVLGVLSPSLALSFFIFLVPTALGLLWLGPTISAVQHLVQPNMRATASAIFLFINNLIGLGLGNLAIGAVSDLLQQSYGEESLRYSILAGTVFYLIAAILFFLASRRLEKDWEH